MASLLEKTDKEILPRRRAKVPAKRAYSVALPTPNSYPFPYEVPVPLARNTRPEEPTTKQAACSPSQQRSTSQGSTQVLGPCAKSSDMATTAVSKPSPPSRPPRPNLHSSPTPKPRVSPRPAVSPSNSSPAIPPRPPPMPKPAIRKVQSEDHGFVRSHSETVSVPSTGSSPVPVPRSNSTIHTSTGTTVPGVDTPPPIPKKRTGSFVSRTHNSMSASSLQVSHSAKSPEEKKKPVERYDPTKAAKQEEDDPYESVVISNKENNSSKDKDPEQGEYSEIGDREEEDDDENGAYAEIGDKKSDEEEEDRGDYEVVKQRSLDEEDEARGDYEILNNNDDEEEEDQDYVPMGSSPSTTPEPPARPPARKARPAPAVPNFPPPRPSRSPQPQPKIAVEASSPVDDDEYTPMSFPDEHTSIYETIDLSRPIPPPRRKKKNKLKQKNSLPSSLSPRNSFSSVSPGHTTTKQAQMHQASAADRKHDNYVTMYKK